jgi:hypothetical protein
MRFRPTVPAVEPKHEFRWKGKLLIRGIFDSAKKQGFAAMNEALNREAERE